MFKVYMQCLNMDINLAQKKEFEFMLKNLLIIESNLKDFFFAKKY